MSRIRGLDTKPEMLLRRGLHAAGFRFRLHVSHLPGRPDLVFQRYRAIIFVNGCFWHGHNCSLFKAPKTRADFWSKKITANKQRDLQVTASLAAADWRVLTVWECSIKGPARLPLTEVISRCAVFVRGCERKGDLHGELVCK
jgi:DNA mismatch endonuclease (patch repair protein)